MIKNMLDFAYFFEKTTCFFSPFDIEYKYQDRMVGIIKIQEDKNYD